MTRSVRAALQAAHGEVLRESSGGAGRRAMVIYDDEPASIIAYTLESQQYRKQLEAPEEGHRQGRSAAHGDARRHMRT